VTLDVDRRCLVQVGGAVYAEIGQHARQAQFAEPLGQRLAKAVAAAQVAEYRQRQAGAPLSKRSACVH
jgi:hypothetical protein